MDITMALKTIYVLTIIATLAIMAWQDYKSNKPEERDYGKIIKFYKEKG